MNKNGKGPNLTWIFIGISVAIVVITLFTNAYTTFLEDNSVEVSDNFKAISGNISENQDTIDTIQGEATNTKKITGVLKEGVNVFVTGLSSIGAFFKMGTLATSILKISQTAIPGFDSLFGLMILIAVFYISMAIIKARRGVSDTS